MQHCEFCGSELPSNARFCGLCGRSQGSMRERQTDIIDSQATKLPLLNMPATLSQSAVSSARPSIELPKSPGEPAISPTGSSPQPKPTGSPQPSTQHHHYERPRRTPQSILLEVLGLEELKKIILKALRYFVKKPENIVWKVIISLIILIGVLTTVVQDWTIVKEVAPKALALLFSFAYHIGLAMLLIYLPSFAITSTNINLLWKSLKEGRAFIISMIV